MKLSKLYSNNSNLFEPIIFNDGLNVIFAKSITQNSKNNLHNLGKSLLIKVIDFCLLKEVRESSHFTKKLLQHELYGEEFKKLTLYLEIKISDKKFLTIKRDFYRATKIYFKESEVKNSNFSNLLDYEWGEEYAIGKAKEFLDGKLNLMAIKPFGYRQGITQFLRHHDDYKNVFQLSKFQYDLDWKPYIAKILGFPYESIKNKLEGDKKIETIKGQIEIYNSLLKNQTRGELQADLDLSKKTIEELEKDLDSFNFYPVDKEIIDKDLSNVDDEISELNNSLYNISNSLKLINKSLNTKIEFDINNIKKIFDEVNIHFNSNTIQSYEKLQEFHKKITKDRNSRLKQQKKELEEEYLRVEEKLKYAYEKRDKYLEAIRSIEELKKYKAQQNLLLDKKSYLKELNDELDKFDIIESLEKDIKRLNIAIDDFITIIKNVVRHHVPEKYKQINDIFSNSIKSIFKNDTASLIIDINKSNNIEFDSKYYKSGKKTEEDKGHTYKKIICIFFDLAVVQSYKDDNFYHFIYHDAVLDSMEEQEKINFINYITLYCNDYNIQYILTAIEDEFKDFKEDDIIKTLTNEGDNGRLFKCKY